MRIVLLRHGIAIDREHPDCPEDPERYLTPSGISRTTKAVRGLKRLGIQPQHVLSSPWRRARQTAKLAVQGLGLEAAQIRLCEELLPGRASQDLLPVLRLVEGEDLLVVGHAPHIDETLALLLRLPSPPACLKKAGAACVALATLQDESPLLEWLATPKMLRRLGQR